MLMKKAGPTSNPEVTSLEFFDQLYTVAQRAIGPRRHVVCLRAASLLVRIEFSDQNLAGKLMPALRHLQVEDASTPDLTIYTWDSSATGTALPDAIWERSDMQPMGRIDGLDTERIRAAFMPRTDGFTMLDLERNIGLHNVPDANTISVHQRSYPFRTLISWVAMQHEMTFVHGAVVGREEGGVLIGGASGSGKSTSALACLNSELLYVSDDHVLLEHQRGDVYAHGLYNSAKLRHEQLLQFPNLQDFAESDPDLDDKALFFVDEIAPKRVVKGLVVRAILVPRIAGEKETRIVPASPAKAMMSLAPSSLFLIPLDQGEAFRRIASFVHKLPVHEIQLGSHLELIPRQIDAFLRGLPS
jgi:hypothetical protein